MYLDWLTLGTDLHVINYERFVEDTRKELEALLKYLRVPVVPERLDCIEKHPLETYKRKRGRNDIREKLLGRLCDSAKARIGIALERVNAELVKRGLNRLIIRD